MVNNFLFILFTKLGIESAAIVPIIPKAISNSVRVNPLLKFSLVFPEGLIFKALSGCPPPELHATSTFHLFLLLLLLLHHKYYYVIIHYFLFIEKRVA